MIALAVLPMLAAALGGVPEIHVLAPGFQARALPLAITNVNALAFDPDGHLFAIAYDGRILRLVDADGDGVEDRAEAFWDKGGLVSPIQAVWAPEGLYVTSHLKVSLLRDDDHDGKADREEVVAKGWPSVPSGSGLVDAMGLAIDRDGSLFVGLGCADFTNPYLFKDGKARYSPKDELGSILKVSPDRRRREIVATGLRFPYALRFNRRGDLFATDQEGETWLHGANPLDELDHVVPGRHYGWPPRHAEHLNTLYDEPPVVGFAPQHQSACGLAFNDPAGRGRPFGPSRWSDDAFVAGFSRGKVWRVRLAKTPAGYVGRPEVLVAAGMMVTDVAVSPSGALYLSCHSGQPDWGTGPRGEGCIYRIVYRNQSIPQPVVAWAAGPLEARVAFDAPLDPSVPSKLPGLAIPFGEHVRAGDRFEPIKPPYKAVEEQQAAPRGSLRVAAARLEDGGRTLVLATDPHPRSARYALALPEPPAELDYTPSGVEASWTSADGASSWNLWWPHLDTDVVRSLTAGSASHDRALERAGRPGRLALRTRLRCSGGKHRLRLVASGPIRARLGDREATAAATDDRRAVEIELSAGEQPIDLAVTLETGNGPATLHASYRDEGDPTERALPLDRLVLPWAPEPMPKPSAPPGLPKEMAGGDPRRGEALFFGETARCSTCHKVRGKGGEVGPDLSNLVHRGAASVYRDIAEPSATINPDYLPFTVALKDGRVLAGVVRSEGDRAMRVLDTNGKSTAIDRADVEAIRPGGASIMPDGLPKAIGPDGMRDLLAFLLSLPEQNDSPPKNP